jgi:SAM-dependent MidA family methyltransferase
MSAFDETVIAEVRRRGKVTFAEFMGWALHHPRHGYYATGLRTGRGGDFVTNAQAGPLFGRLLAGVIADVWDALGSERLTLVELGGADGALAESVLRALEAMGRVRRVAFHLVEASPPARAAARRRLSRFGAVEVHASLEDLEHVAGVEGVVYSNEFFDALPFHRVLQREGKLQELFVVEENGVLAERPGAPSTPRLAEAFRETGASLAEGCEAEVCLALEETYSDIARVLARGLVLTVDYGEGAPGLYGEDRPRGTRRTFARHAVGDSPFSDIGRQDITAHVDFTRLALEGARHGLTPVLYAPQGSFFLQAGEKILRDAVEGGGDRAAAVRQVQQLIHPRAFGGSFQVFLQEKNAEGVAWPGLKANRIQRLSLPVATQSNIFSSSLPSKS